MIGEKKYTIAVNTRLLIKNRLDGIGRFSFETLKRITRQHPEHHFIFLFDRPYDNEFIFSDNITPIILHPQARHPVLFCLWFEISVANTLNKLKPDLFLSPDGYLSLRSNCKSLSVIHDINFAHYPGDLPFVVRKYYNYFFPRFAHKATRIATVSEYSKDDICSTYEINENTVDVVYNGSGEKFVPLEYSAHHKVKEKYTGGFDYFLFVGSLHPRKNISRLLQAFDAFKKAKENKIKLLIVGDKYWWNDEMENAYKEMEFKNHVVFTGRLNDDELTLVYGAAFALTYFPYFEGFGIPVLEAMSCDVPVVCSDTTSMPEIADRAALFANPFSVDDIKDALLKITFDEKLRRELIQKGRLRKQYFSWDRTADLLWQSVKKAINS